MANNVWDAADYETRFGFVTRSGDDLIDALDPGPGQQILDLGCGPGRHSAQIAQRGADVVGMDLDPDMLAKARADHPGVDFASADAASFTLAHLGRDRPFDGCLSNAALHWMNPQVQGCGTCGRSCAVGPGSWPRLGERETSPPSTGLSSRPWPGWASRGPNRRARTCRAAANVGLADRSIALLDAAIEELGPDPDTDRLAHLVIKRAIQCDGAQLDPFADLTRAMELATAAFMMLETDLEPAHALAERGLAAAEESGDAVQRSSAHNVLACLPVHMGRPDEGQVHLDQARDTARAQGSGPALFRYYGNHADVLIGTGRFAETIGLAREGRAETTARGLGRTTGALLAGSEAEAEQLRCWPSSPGGMSNRAIADTLFITVETASVHVSNILAKLGKLGVSSRTEAAAWAPAHPDGRGARG